MAATVFVFKGRAHYARPGIDWAMSTQEDYAPARECNRTWAKTQAWLCAHSYRQLWAMPVGRDGCDVVQVWGLVSVFGDTNVSYTGTQAVKARYDHRVAEQQPIPTPTDVVTQMQILIVSAQSRMRDRIASENPDLTAREINEEMKARMEMGCYD